MPFRAQDKTKDERCAAFSYGSLRLTFRPLAEYPNTTMRLERDGKTFEELLQFSHLALAKVLSFDFRTVLDIGVGSGTVSRAMRWLGKETSSIDSAMERTPDNRAEYSQTTPLGPFDLVWASHVLEHQRNPGLFLDKVFTDTKEGGLVAITMPAALSPLLIGHPTILTPMHLAYHLVLAGFDCRDAMIRQYDWQFSVILRKKPNGIRCSNVATTHYPIDAPDYNPRLLDWFPVKIENGAIWGEIESLNW